MGQNSGLQSRIAGAVCGGLFLLTLLLMSPGRMGNDELDMFRQALAGQYHDWHSPLIAWVWSLGLHLRPGSGSIHGLEIAVYFLGVYLLATGAIAKGFAWAGWAIVAFSIFPLTWILLATAGSKDAFLAGIMLVLAGTLARFGGSRRKRTAIAALVLIVAGIAMQTRLNAVFAVFPILAAGVWLLLDGRVNGRLGRLAAAAGLGAVLALGVLGTSSAITRTALSVKGSHILAALFIYDLAGISARANVDAADGFLGAEFQPSLSRCYDRLNWDPYSLWGNCPQSWQRLFGGGLFEEPGQRETRSELFGYWLQAIAAHPVAYAAHRLTYFIAAIGLGERPPWEMSPVDIEAADAPFAEGFAPLLRSINQGAIFLAALPVFQPFVWLALGCAGLLLLFFLPHSSTGAVAAGLLVSGICYELGYLFVGVSYALRYSHWTIAAETIGLLWTAMAAVETARNPGWSGSDFRLRWSEGLARAGRYFAR